MKETDLNQKRIIISRTDSIGDVMLTLPMCAWIKQHHPDSTIIFLGKGYTRPIVNCFQAVDEFEDWADYLNAPKAERVEKFRELNADVIIHVFPDREIASLAKKVKVPVRVGTSHRSYHLLTCTHRVNFTRRKSDLHESQLNFELLRPFGLKEIPDLNKVSGFVSHFKAPGVQIPEEIEKSVQESSKAIVLHPKSQGSALEWPMENYVSLTNRLVERGYTVLFTGTEKEGQLFREQIPTDSNVIDTTGKLSLEQLIVLISKVDYLVACSTGPLHIAGFLGVGTIGFFSPRRPIHPGRWKALGPRVTILVDDSINEKEKERKYIENVSVDQVLTEIA